MLLSLLVLLPLTLASPLEKLQKRQSASGSGSGSATATPTATSKSFVPGASTSNIYPPPGVSAGPTSDFPNESQIGYPGPTPTGVEPHEISASVYPYKTAAFPLIIPSPSGSNQNAESSELFSSGQFNALRYWGNLSPWHSDLDGWGLPNATPSMPDQCEIVQVSILYRHGSRYPTSGSIATYLSGVLANSTGFNATGDLAFLNTWQYPLGAELLTPFGRLQDFELGVGFRNLYGQLLNNFTRAGVLPVFTTESEDRMVKTALNFMAGFFGVPEYQTQANLLIEIEAKGFNNSGAPYETCTNSNNARGNIGNSVAATWLATAFQPTAQRIQGLVTGLNVTTQVVNSMINLCAYGTIALGSSPFCSLFTEQDFMNWEYSFDLAFYYNNGFGSPVAAAQGLGFLNQYIDRLSGSYSAATGDSPMNTTFNNPTQKPLNQSIYADATHEVVVCDTLTALNLTALAASGPLPLDHIPDNYTFVASKIVPMATHLVTQVLECATYTPTRQMRFILNDAVVPLNNYNGCPQNEYNGLCAFDTVLSNLKARSQEINYNYACFGNYTVPTPGTQGQDLNGLPPQNATSSSSSSGGSSGGSASSSSASASASASSS